MSVVCGVNWGDEGKGRMVDYISSSADVVVRYQGGNNAGHTVVNEFGKFALHLIPSGIFRKGVVNVLGPGVIVDLEGLANEIDELAGRGVDVSSLIVSDRAMVCFPFSQEKWTSWRKHDSVRVRMARPKTALRRHTATST